MYFFFFFIFFYFLFKNIIKNFFFFFFFIIINIYSFNSLLNVIYNICLKLIYINVKKYTKYLKIKKKKKTTFIILIEKTILINKDFKYI